MDLDALIYNGMTNSKVGERGEILIAEPLLTDPWFGRSVVLMLDRDKKGGRLGLTMNKVLPLSLADLFPDWPEASAVKVYQG
ncbi:MAG: YqgE/AlgH family protein, partial [Muribaculaceae bacterium]|nr:YqgE/AlgH family protein [Muribaculaceae bacterium]